MEKTNVMRLLDIAKINYTPLLYSADIDKGEEVAEAVGKSADEVFKTLVTVSDGGHFVFVVPVNCTLNLKKAAKAAGVNSVEMLKQRDLLPLTGYVHGGCSPIGMKKPFPTFINDTAELFETICVSAGRRGFHVELSPVSLASFVGAAFFDLCD
ncbi:MAG: Cys-tRNA(Pro) deacylase [Clostridia bacterium]|nr:Cys-tRNA(Pro) deacylase [Clostridia bacterium]